MSLLLSNDDENSNQQSHHQVEFKKPAPPPIQDTLTAFDGIRAISMIWVCVYHVLYSFSFHMPPHQFQSAIHSSFLFRIIYSGDLAVDTFFLFSGFFLSKQLSTSVSKNTQIEPKKLILTRFLRLAPPYYVSIVFVALCRRFLFGQGWTNIQFAWRNLFFLNNLFAYSQDFMGNSWSMACDFQFQVLFILALFAMQKIHRNFPKALLHPVSVVTLILLGLAIRLKIIIEHDMKAPVSMHSWHLSVAEDVDFRRMNSEDIASFKSTSLQSQTYLDLLYSPLYARFSSFLFGVLLESRFRRYARGSKPYAPFWDTFLLLSVLVAALHSPFNTLIEWPNYGNMLYLSAYRHIFAVIMFSWLLSEHKSGFDSIVSRFLSHPWLKWIAQLSFTIYLLNYDITIWMASTVAGVVGLSEFSLMWLSCLCMAVNIGLAYLLRLLVEQPSLLLVKHFREASQKTE